MRKPAEDIQVFKQRRKAVLEKLGASAMIVTANPEHIRNDDVHYPYRQDSNMYYLTGFEEPESILMLLPGRAHQVVMFVREKNILRETWDGFRYGPDLAQQIFQVDKTYPIDEFQKVAPELMRGFDSVYYRRLKYPEFDVIVDDLLSDVKAMFGRSGYGLMSVLDADTFLGEFRLIKSAYELENQRKACEISAQGHVAAMRFTKPNVNERQVQAVLTHEFLMRGAAREGYNYIVASGNSATTLHYNFNDQKCKDGDLLLIDAGAEYNYYSGDITRTYPVNGRFTEAQAQVYEGVLKIQKEIIKFVKPGIVFRDLHEMATSLLTDFMLELGLFVGRKEDILKANEHKKYYPHGLGHWLGMDVHDAGLYMINEVPRPITENMVFTVEPGLYLPENDKNVPEKYRGIGVRIEDNVVVNGGGCEVMTSSAPKEIADLEKVIGKGL